MPSLLGDAGEVALDVGHEDRHTQAREAFGQGLQGDGLAGAGGTGDQAVAVGLVGAQMAANVSIGAGVAGNENAFVVKSGHGSGEVSPKVQLAHSVTIFLKG